MKQKELERKGKYWQKRLRLQDWVITFKACKKHEMKDDLGKCYHNRQTKYATIEVDVESNTMGYDWPYNPEVSIVHELLHLHFAAFWNDKKTAELEVAIDNIAEALVNEKGGKK